MSRVGKQPIDIPDGVSVEKIHQPTGTLWFEQGTLVHAECGDAEGESAFGELASWHKGTFVIHHGEQAPRRGSALRG